MNNWTYTVQKGQRISRPQPGCHLPNSPWPGKIKLFPARESLVSDIPSWDRKTVNLFYSVLLFALCIHRLDMYGYVGVNIIHPLACGVVR